MILRIACDHIPSLRAASKSVRLGDADPSQRLAGLIRTHLGQRLTSILPPLSHVCILPARSPGGAYHDLHRLRAAILCDRRCAHGIKPPPAGRRDLGASMLPIRGYVMAITYVVYLAKRENAVTLA